MWVVGKLSYVLFPTTHYQMSVFPKPYADAVARLRVTSGFVLLIAFAWLSHPDAESLAAGLPVSVVGCFVPPCESRSAAFGMPRMLDFNEDFPMTKMLAAVLDLLLRKHLILERELIDALKK